MDQPEWKSSYDNDGDRFAGIKKVLARIFGDGENPLAWGFPFFNILGLRFKIHLLMVVYLLAQLIFTMPGHNAGAVFVIPNLVAMVILVILHELAHAYVARRNGGSSAQRMLWPLGGLEPSRFEEEDPKAELRTALAGPALHLALIPFLVIPIVLLTGSWDATIFNPLSPSSSIHNLILASDQTTPWWLVTIWAFHVVNIIILLANLIPMHPFDGATILRIYLSSKRGDLAARHAVAFSGLWVATAVGLVGMVFADAKMLLAIAIVAGIVCTLERRRLQFLDYAQMVPGYSNDHKNTDSSPKSEPLEPDSPPTADLDEILEKISASGIESLTRRERRTLKKATESSRKAE
ncbi:MAG: hypothetical protein JKY43_10085 [Phycisphaerales bacterium]|nr:hypothetical protein [Phycisphaerales bacterium]